MAISIFKKKKVALGEGHVVQYTLFEWKRFGGIWFYNWKTIDQMRFHTHAFNAVAILLNGGYLEEVIDADGKITTKKVDQRFKLRRIPMAYCHRILASKQNTWTVVFFGPWAKTWREYFPETGEWVRYGWGRKVLYKRKGGATDAAIRKETL